MSIEIIVPWLALAVAIIALHVAKKTKRGPQGERGERGDPGPPGEVVTIGSATVEPVVVTVDPLNPPVIGGNTFTDKEGL